MRRLILLLTLPLFCTSLLGQATADWEPIIRRLIRDGFDEARMRAVFARPEARFDSEPMAHKLHSLFESRFKSGQIRAIQQGLQQLGYDPGEVDGMEGPRTRNAILQFQRKQRIPRDGKVSSGLLRAIQEALDPSLKDRPQRKGPPVYDVILRTDRLEEARDFLDQNRPQLAALASQYGIPEEVAVGILTVETRVGKYLGEKKAFNTLASMARLSHYQTVEPFFQEEILTSERKIWLTSNAERVANWAYRELVALLHYTDTNQQDPLSLVGSIYGAIGLAQFMPTSVLEFGVDGNGDGRVDLFNLEDALHSMANYLRRNGWKDNTRSRQTQARVLYRYNRSRTYVNTVLAVADHLQSEDDR